MTATDLRRFHADHGARFEEVAGREVVARYRNPERTHRAVRNGVGVIDRPFGVIVVTGSDRVEYVENGVTNRVPATEGRGCYAFLLDPQGRIEADLYVYNAGERLLLFAPPGTAREVVDGWEVFIQDVTLRVATDEFATFSLCGPRATEKVASVLSTVGAPEEPLSFVRGKMGDDGVTVIRGDDLAGEVSYDVVCTADRAVDVLDTLLNRGMNAVPFGGAVWDSLTLEAGTPLFETELAGRVVNATGVRNGIDFDKGCFVGQEVAARIENRGHPSTRLVGLRPDSLPAPGAAVVAGDASVGEVTRAVESPTLEEPIALAAVDWEPPDDLAIRVDGETVPAVRVDLPFVEGSGRSARLPTYPA